MSLFVIAGINRCDRFTEVCFIANKFTKLINNFHIATVIKQDDEYLVWLKHVRDIYGWEHFISPIIWRENVVMAGTLQYIGNDQDFYEYIYEHYGLNYYITGEIRRHIKEQCDINKLISPKKSVKVRRNVCVFGARGFATKILISELLQLPDLELNNGITVTLYANTYRKSVKLEKLAKDLRILGMKSGLDSVVVSGDLPDVLKTCDLFVILDLCTRQDFMSMDGWLNMNKQVMTDLASLYDDCAPDHCRVVLVGNRNSPVCFNATVIADNLKVHSPKNIVAVTHDLGLECVPLIVQTTGSSFKVIKVPPVWGFIGINKCVDFVVSVSEVVTFRPDHKVMLTKYRKRDGIINYNIKDCKICKATAWDENLYFCIENQKKFVQDTLHMAITTSKLQATVDLIRLWYSTDWHGAVISAGVMSDGSFNIPKRMFFSQPSSLSPFNNCWRPHKWSQFIKEPFYNSLIRTANDSLRILKVGKNLDGIWMIKEEERQRIKEKEERELKMKRDEWDDKLLVELFRSPIVGPPEAFPFYEDIMDKVQETVGEEIEKRPEEYQSDAELNFLSDADDEDDEDDDDDLDSDESS